MTKHYVTAPGCQHCLSLYTLAAEDAAPHALMFLKFFFRSQPFTRMLPCSFPPDRRPASAFTNDVLPEPME